MNLNSRRNLIQAGALVTCLPSLGIEKLSVKYQSKGLFVLGVSIDKDLSAAKAHFQKHRYSFPCTWLDPNVKSELKKPSSVPEVTVYGNSGLLVQHEKGQMFPEDVQALSRWI